MKTKVKGIILVFSCQKYINSRLKEFKLQKDEYNGWKVMYVIGDLFLDQKYKVDGTLITIHCEDSYIHLLKKVALSIEVIYELFEVEEGILRSGDDLEFNYDNLIKFLDGPKTDYMGYYYDYSKDNYLYVCDDPFMVDYYKSHQEDFDNPQHNIKGLQVEKYVRRPAVSKSIEGVLMYLSNKACQCIIHYMNYIHHNIFYFEPQTQSYPFTIEDIGIAFILYINGIYATQYPLFAKTEETRNKAVAYHTNKYK
jgi:hypothetical protein